jgi:Trp operon repressor
MKVRAKNLTDKERIEVLDMLYTAAGAVRGRDAMKLFLRDLLTESERIMLGRRIIIARKLISGESHRTIEAELKVGKDTVWRVQCWLYDQFPGFENAIAELEKELDKRQFKKMYATSAMFRLKKKYPLHFLLFPTPKPTKKK